MTPPNVEQWRPMVGEVERYEVSDIGRVRSRPRERTKGGTLTVWPIPDEGYVRFHFRRNGKSFSRMVHRLVLEAFVGPCPDGKEAAHLNGDRGDNRLANLAWVTPKENSDHQLIHGTRCFGEKNHHAKLTTEQAMQILVACASEPVGDVARRFGVSYGAVYNIRSRRNWRHL